MKPFWTVNHWKQLIEHGFFHYNVLFIKIEFSGIALFNFGMNPSGYPDEYYISLCILGFGAVWKLKLPIL